MLSAGCAVDSEAGWRHVYMPLPQPCLCNAKSKKLFDRQQVADATQTDGTQCLKQIPVLLPPGQLDEHRRCIGASCAGAHSCACVWPLGPNGPQPVLLRWRHAPSQLRLGGPAPGQVKRGWRRHCCLGHGHAAGCSGGRPGRMAPPPWQGPPAHRWPCAPSTTWHAGRVGPRAVLAPPAMLAPHCEVATARCCRTAPRPAGCFAPGRFAGFASWHARLYGLRSLQGNCLA